MSEMISTADRGLLYGDGVFETLAWVHHQPVWFEQHWQRFVAGCQRLDIPVPDQNRLLDLIAQKVDPAKTRQVVKWIYTRGQGGRGYRPPLPAQPNLQVQTFDWPDYPPSWYEQGVEARWCSTPVSINPALVGIKHLCRLENVLARAEWQDETIAEGLMCDALGYVIEATQSNLVIVKNQTLITPLLTQSGIAGIALGQFKQQAIKSGINWTEHALRREDVVTADAVILCNSIMGCVHVQRLEYQQFPKPDQPLYAIMCELNSVLNNTL